MSKVFIGLGRASEGSKRASAGPGRGLDGIRARQSLEEGTEKKKEYKNRRNPIY